MLDLQQLNLIDDEAIPYTDLGGGMQRKIMKYSDELMVTKMTFEAGAVGALHNHPHLQIGYVLEGSFEVSVGKERKVLKKGDLFYAPSMVFHGVLCLENGMLLDIFNPKRDDFLS